MTIQIDSREKSKAIEAIVKDFDENGVQHFTSKLYVGDYMSLDNPRLVIDRKQNLFELANNVSSVPKKEKDGRIKKDANGKPMTELQRFTRELRRAKEAGIHVIVLCEHSRKIRKLEDVRHWVNPRLKVSPLTMSGERLYTVLSMLTKTYDFEVKFCEKARTGAEIRRLLGGMSDAGQI